MVRELEVVDKTGGDPEGEVQYQTTRGRVQEGLETGPAGTELCTPQRQVKGLTPIPVTYLEIGSVQIKSS